MSPDQPASTSLSVPRRRKTAPRPSVEAEEEEEEEEGEAALAQEFDVTDGYAEELLGYDAEQDEDEGDEGGDVGSGDDHEEFRKQMRLDATRRAEGNRRKGGLKTQHAMKKLWEVS